MATRARWVDHLRRPSAMGRTTREAVITVFGQWMARRHGSLTFHLTQLLTGHGCFNAYLHRRNRAPTDVCAHWLSSVDTNIHTLEECPSWNAERDRLREILGVPKITLELVVSHMVSSPVHWKAVTCFAEHVMRAKKEAERDRERQAAMITKQLQQRNFGTVQL